SYVARRHEISIVLSFLFFLTIQVILLGAWVTGYLDPYQKQPQELVLDYMESLTDKKLTEDQNLSKIQDQLGNQLDGVFGKGGGGLGEGFGCVEQRSLRWWTVRTKDKNSKIDFGLKLRLSLRLS
ncbi:hypothetical protein N7516_003779, partial [Penicillium verrucosum]|uniref:uncharacterized protein n=1 Tax=Penicillium verrucosum TaxID=60171 RepID=UPI002544F693